MDQATSQGTPHFEHQGMVLGYTPTERGPWQHSINTQGDVCTRFSPVPAPPLELAIAGRPYGVAGDGVRGLTNIPREMEASAPTWRGGDLTQHFKHHELGIEAEVLLTPSPTAPVMRSRTRVRNTSDKAQVLTHVSSAVVNGFAADGLLPWLDPRKVRVHFCRQAWEGEGQWQCAGLEELGLLRTSVHECRSAAQFSAMGTFSTARMLPQFIIEDLETRKAWFVQIETSSHWFFEISFRAAGDAGSLFLQAGAADERLLGWAHELMPGETYESVPVAFGCCEGGFTEAIHALTRYRREMLKPAPAWDGYAPVAFNDYMNCLWGNPTEENLLPLIDAAADAGIEAFVIDAGWFGPRGQS